MRLLIAGGGTGGHLYPAIAVAEEFMGRDSSNEILFVGTKRGIEARLLPEYGWPVRYVMAGGIKGMGLPGMLKGALKMICGAFQSVGIIARFRPGAILGVGGYASAPAVLAGRLMGVKSAIHEQNAMPGVTNRVLGKLVHRVFLTYPESERFFSAGKVKITGNPVRKEIIKSLKDEKEENIHKGCFTILVFGGSRGARKINDVVVETLGTKAFDGKRLRIIHQTGYEDFDRIKESYKEVNIEVEVYPYIEDMAGAYGKADLVVCRAGATSISELLIAGKPSILVPYPHAADDHQALNARSVVNDGAAVMVLERELTAERLSGEIMLLYDNKDVLQSMAEKASDLSRSDAAAAICDEIKNMTGDK